MPPRARAVRVTEDARSVPMTQHILTVENDGPEIVATNYWESEHAARGYYFLTINAGAFRLLVPDSRLDHMPEMHGARKVDIERCPSQRGRIPPELTLWFDDGTDSPWRLVLSPEQCDRLPGPRDVGPGAPELRTLSVWTRGPTKVLELPCTFAMMKPRIGRG